MRAMLKRLLHLRRQRRLGRLAAIPSWFLDERSLWPDAGAVSALTRVVQGSVNSRERTGTVCVRNMWPSCTGRLKDPR